MMPERYSFLALLALAGTKVVRVRVSLPLRSIAHADDKLQAHHQDTGVSQHNKDVFAHIMAEGVELLVGQRTGNEEECQVEIRLVM